MYFSCVFTNHEAYRPVIDSKEAFKHKFGVIMNKRQGVFPGVTVMYDIDYILSSPLKLRPGGPSPHSRYDPGM